MPAGRTAGRRTHGKPTSTAVTLSAPPPPLPQALHVRCSRAISEPDHSNSSPLAAEGLFCAASQPTRLLADRLGSESVRAEGRSSVLRRRSSSMLSSSLMTAENKFTSGRHVWPLQPAEALCSSSGLVSKRRSHECHSGCAVLGMAQSIQQAPHSARSAQSRNPHLLASLQSYGSNVVRRRKISAPAPHRQRLQQPEE